MWLCDGRENPTWELLPVPSLWSPSCFSSQVHFFAFRSWKVSFHSSCLIVLPIDLCYLIILKGCCFLLLVYHGFCFPFYVVGLCYDWWFLSFWLISCYFWCGWWCCFHFLVFIFIKLSRSCLRERGCVWFLVLVTSILKDCCSWNWRKLFLLFSFERELHGWFSFFTAKPHANKGNQSKYFLL